MVAKASVLREPMLRFPATEPTVNAKIDRRKFLYICKCAFFVDSIIAHSRLVFFIYGLWPILFWISTRCVSTGLLFNWNARKPIFNIFMMKLDHILNFKIADVPGNSDLKRRFGQSYFPSPFYRWTEFNGAVGFKMPLNVLSRAD